MALTELQKKVLVFESSLETGEGSKEGHIRDEFGLSATRYYQLLDALLQNRDALAAEPMLIHRLQRAKMHKEELREKRRLR